MKVILFAVILSFSSLKGWGFVDSTKYAPFQIPSFGKVERIDSFPSLYVDARNIEIWLPDGYDSSINYPVLYMQDGQMLFDSMNTWNKKEWRVDENAQFLINQNKIRPFMIVAIWNSGKMRHSDYFPQKPFESFTPKVQDSIYSSIRYNGNNYFFGKVQSDNYLLFLTKELKPFIDSTFSTLPDRSNTFVMGSSMGGLISLYALCEYPNIFGGAACLSTHWIGVGPDSKIPIPKAFQNYLKSKLPPAKDHKIYFDYGTSGLDSHYKVHQVLVNSIMKKKGYTKKNWKTKEFKGADHSEDWWAKRLVYPFMFLLGK